MCRYERIKPDCYSDQNDYVGVDRHLGLEGVRSRKLPSDNFRIIECASSAVGRTLVFTSSARDSTLALVLRKARNMPRRIANCSSTAAAVTPMKTVSRVLSICSESRSE